MKPGPAGDASPRWLASASGLLAVGSSFLIAGGSIWFSGAFRAEGFSPLFGVFYGLTLAGAMVHLVAWVVLYRGLWGLSDSPRTRALRRAFVLSIVAFAAAALTAPYHLSFAFYGSQPPLSLLLYSLFYSWFFVFYWPYIPLVFSPVVLFHAYLFWRLAPPPQRWGAYPVLPRRVAILGALWLAAMTAVGVAGQVAYAAGAPESPGIIFATVLGLPAGLTAFGYGLEFLVFRAAKVQAVPPEGPAATRGSAGL